MSNKDKKQKTENAKPGKAAQNAGHVKEAGSEEQAASTRSVSSELEEYKQSNADAPVPSGTVRIPFMAKTETGERLVPIEITWNWGMFLGPDGSTRYDNQIAIAACALANAAYNPGILQVVLDALGFEDQELFNYGTVNKTSAFALSCHRIRKGGNEKAVFAVVNRGSTTFLDWKGNILDETILDSGYFEQCARNVLDKLRPFVKNHGCADPADNLFLVTGHSLGGVASGILAARHMTDWPARNVYAYTFAAPRAASLKETTRSLASVAKGLGASVLSSLLATNKVSDKSALGQPALEPGQDPERPIYNVLNEKDIVISLPPQLTRERLGSNNFSFVPAASSSRAMADQFQRLSGMEISKLEKMNRDVGGFLKNSVQIIAWNHSLTTYMAYLLAGGPEKVRSGKSFLWQFLQNW